MGEAWIVATGNAHKVREIDQILRPVGVELVTPRELGVTLDVEEWGSSFAENAAIKALAYAQATGRLALADDSGLEVAALGWGPGIYSARYAGPDATDKDNNAKLLKALEDADAEGRQSRYRCVIAIVRPYDGSKTVSPIEAVVGLGANDRREILGYEVRTFDGALHGRIESDARGKAGFGYDPYFALPSGKHVAELTDAEKNMISHRGVALRKLAEFLASSS